MVMPGRNRSTPAGDLAEDTRRTGNVATSCAGVWPPSGAVGTAAPQPHLAGITRTVRSTCARKEIGMGNHRLGACLALGCVLVGGIATAQPAKSGVTPQVMLGYRPKQDAVTITTP